MLSFRVFLVEGYAELWLTKFLLDPTLMIGLSDPTNMVGGRGAPQNHVRFRTVSFFVSLSIRRLACAMYESLNTQSLVGKTPLTFKL